MTGSREAMSGPPLPLPVLVAAACRPAPVPARTHLAAMVVTAVAEPLACGVSGSPRAWPGAARGRGHPVRRGLAWQQRLAVCCGRGLDPGAPGARGPGECTQGAAAARA